MHRRGHTARGPVGPCSESLTDTQTSRQEKQRLSLAARMCSEIRENFVVAENVKTQTCPARGYRLSGSGMVANDLARADDSSVPNLENLALFEFSLRLPRREESDGCCELVTRTQRSVLFKEHPAVESPLAHPADARKIRSLQYRLPAAIFRCSEI